MKFDLLKKTVAVTAVAFMCVSCGETVNIADPQNETSSQESSLETVTAEKNTANYDFVISMDTIKSVPKEEIIEEVTENVTETDAKPSYQTTTEKGIRTSAPDDYVLPEHYAVYVKTVMQRPELPTGCEITSLTQTLNHYGFDIDKTELCDNFLPIDYSLYYTMDEVYLGDPYSEVGYGCNAPVIEETANNYFKCIGSDWRAEDISGSDFDDLLYNIAEGRPVIMWATMWMYEQEPEFTGTLGCGKDLIFSHYQHCVTIYGYDYRDNTIHTADPLVGNTKYSIEQVKKIYEMMGSQAVILYGKEETAGKEFMTKEAQEAWLKESGVGGTVTAPPETTSSAEESTVTTAEESITTAVSE